MPPPRLSLKRQLARFCFPRYSLLLDRLNWNARWMQAVRNNRDYIRRKDREDLYRWVNSTFLANGDHPIDYFEFGVFEGWSLKVWSNLNQAPDSRFFGFDWFKGLPSEWHRGARAGIYDVQGKIPQFQDKRVQLIPGLFQQTLPCFLSNYEPRNRVLIHNDSDLFSSTLYVLCTMDRLIAPGTLVIFDEFYDPLHEFRALYEYAEAYQRPMKILAGTPGLAQAVVRIG